MGDAEKETGMTPIRIIEWAMLNKPAYVGTQVGAMLSTTLTFHPFMVIQNRISMGHREHAYSGMLDAFRKVVR